MTGKTEARMRTIRCRTREYRQRQENRQLSCLTACSLLLVTAIGALVGSVQTPGIAEVAGGYGAVLLRSGADAYVFVGIVTFFLGVSVTVLCIRLKNKSTSRTERTKEREKTL